jgi:hypothetical protein
MNDEDLTLSGTGGMPGDGQTDRAQTGARKPHPGPQGGARMAFRSQENRWKNTQTGEEGRHRMDESLSRKAFKQAVGESGFAKRATCHPLRHSSATRLPESGYDTRTVQELLGHSEVKITMIYTHVLNRGGKGVKSPVDDLYRRIPGVLYRNHISPAPSLASGLTACIHEAYAGWGDGALCREFAAQRCYEETI